MPISVKSIVALTSDVYEVPFRSGRVYLLEPVEYEKMVRGVAFKKCYEGSWTNSPACFCAPHAGRFVVVLDSPDDEEIALRRHIAF